MRLLPPPSELSPSDGVLCRVGGLTAFIQDFGTCCGPVPCLVLKQGPELPKEPHQLEDEFLSEDEDEEEELPRD